MITVLAGGVGAARFLVGLTAVVDAADVTAIVNTGDDVELHGLWVSPDLDTVTYTLAGAINPETGWGLVGETWEALGALRRYEAVRPAGSRAGGTWFGLGDRDLATHLYRTARRREGAPLSTVTGEIAHAWGLGVRLVPMSDDPVPTMVTVDDGEIGFQDYFVGRRHDVPVHAVRFDGAERARPAPGVLEAIRDADVVVISPSNPLVSIAPIRAVPGIEAALRARRDHVVAVSPIIAGAALKGPADHMLTELGHDSSVVGIARIYAPVASTLVIDDADAGRAAEVEAAGVACVVAPTVMAGRAEAAALAGRVLAAR
ncbi:MAG TPA: 2-phospho-L-lactate transferase [Acidimicrobiales bacterium]|nr:2-phospho-L-lactate transferase [Acidimicrobiales bacterium]